MKNKFVKIICLALVAVMALALFPSCNGKDDAKNATKLSFKSASGFDYLKSLDGKKVTINGYVATSSPVDGSFIFLMNLPYQSCPFCVPNTTELSNTIEVFPKKGERFDYTAQAIKVVGTLEVAPSEDQPFTDSYGYTFSFKIVDATYTILKDKDLSADMALWQKLAETDVVNDIYKMYDYVSFLCYWNEYFMNDSYDENGNKIPGYYLYPTDAEKFLYPDGAQYNYGYKEGYFDSIVSKIESVDKSAFADLVKNIRDAEALATKAISELENGNYTYEEKYVEKFGTYDKVYTLTNGTMLDTEFNALFNAFSNWLGSWEM